MAAALPRFRLASALVLGTALAVGILFTGTVAAYAPADPSAGGLNAPADLAPSPTPAPASPTATATPHPTATAQATGTASTTAAASPTASPAATRTATPTATVGRLPKAPATCTQGQWVGLPYLNEYFNSNCTTFVQATTIGGSAVPSLTINTTQTITIEANVTIAAGASLSANGGQTFVSTGNFGLFVAGPSGNTPGGTLSLIGTASEPITLTGSAGTAGQWQGIGFDTGSTGALTDVNLSDAGIYCMTLPSGGTCYRSSIVVKGSNPIVSNTNVTGSGGNDLEVDAEGNPTLTNDSFATTNGFTAVYYDTLPASFTQDSGLSASGAGLDQVSFPGGTISGAGTWNQASLGVPLVIGGNVSVAAGGSFTVTAGSELEFNGNYGLYADKAANSLPAATLTLSGTASQPITLTATSGNNWGGLAFDEGSGGTLDHVTVSDAGNYCLQLTTACYRTGIAMDQASPTISNTTVTTGAGGANGVEVDAGGNPTLTNDTFTNNPGTAVYYDTQPTAFTQDRGLSASGNGANVVRFPGGTLAAAGTWDQSQLGVPLVLDGEVTVAAGGSFTVTAGSALEFSGNFPLLVASASGNQPAGSLSLIGTASAPITLTGTTGTAGQWQGIGFDPGSTGTLGFVHESGAGSYCLSLASGCVQTGIGVDEASPTISDSTLDALPGNAYALQVADNATLPILANDTFVGDNILVSPDGLARLSGIDLVGSGLTIDVLGGSLAQSDVWPNAGAPYRLLADLTVPVTTTLSVPQPIDLGVNGNYGLYVEGALTMTGTASTPISLTASSGNWKGIAFDTGSRGSLTDVTVADAGGYCTTLPSGGTCYRSSIVVKGSSPTISNSTVIGSAGNDLEVDTSGNPTLLGDSFATTSSFTAVLYDTLPAAFTQDHALSASGPGANQVSFPKGTIASPGSWDQASLGIPLVINQDVNVAAGGSLAISPGSVVQFSGNYGLYADGPSGSLPGGSLELAGTASAPIILTGTAGTAGWWKGIAFDTGSGGTLDHVTVSDAGGYCLSLPTGGNCYRAAIAARANPIIGNTTISASGGDDVDVDQGGLPVLHDDSFGSVSGGDFGVQVFNWSSGQNQVDATNNWWGSSSGPAGPGLSGTGVTVSAGVFVTPWLCGPLADCAGVSSPLSVALNAARTAGARALAQAALRRSSRPVPVAAPVPVVAPVPVAAPAVAPVAAKPTPAGGSVIGQALGWIGSLLGGGAPAATATPAPVHGANQDASTPVPAALSAQCSYLLYLPRVDNQSGGAGFSDTAAAPVAQTNNNCTPTPTNTVVAATATNTAVAATATNTSGPATATNTPVPASPTPSLTPTVTPTFGSGAPALPQDVASNLSLQSQFLYTGSNAVQKGVSPTVMVPQRVAVIRGTVTQQNSQPLADVTISVLNHPEFGSTTSQSDGSYNLAVNGGGLLTLIYTATGFPTVERTLNVPWQDYTWAPTVVMLPYDSTVTTITLPGTVPMQVARGSVISDSSGSRQATLLFPQGTTADMVFSNGITQTLTTLHVHATEFTVGTNGPNAMPGQLPVNSSYTYAAEFTVDEAQNAGATSVQFSPSLTFYLQNFLNFPVGDVIPSGYFDRTQGHWVAAPNGVVVKILSISNGAAVLDVTGSGQASSAAELAQYGITTAELQELATLYSAGQTLERVPVAHFSAWDEGQQTDVQASNTTPPEGNAWDYNQGTQPETPAPTPTVPPPTPDTPVPTPTCTSQAASTIDCANQTLGEDVPVAGTGWQLHYRSNRMPGYLGANSVSIPLTGSSISPTLAQVQLLIQVAGQQLNLTFPAQANLTYNYTWNGRDGYGRPVQGAQPLSIQVGYTYPAVYQPMAVPSNYDAVFGHFTYYGAPVSANAARTQITLWQYQQGTVGGQTVGSWDERAVGLGGWSLDNLNSYDPVGKVLYKGDGTQDQVANINYTMASVASLGRNAGPNGMAVGPDGTLYVTTGGQNQLWAVPPGGTPTVVAGTGTAGFSGDNGPATQAQLNAPHGVAVGPDGSIYVADTGNQRIRKITTSGTITTVAGTGVAGSSGDFGPATAAELNGPTGLAVANDGTMYIADTFNNRVRQIGPDGVISTAAGTGAYGSSGDGGPGLQAELAGPVGVAVDPQGVVYVADQGSARIRQIGGDGYIQTVAGTGNWGFSGDGGSGAQAQIGHPWGLALAPNGSVAIADLENFRVRQVAQDGTITTTAGMGPCLIQTTYCPSANGNPPTQVLTGGPAAVAVAPDGSLYLSDYYSGQILRLAAPLPGFTGSQIAIPSDDGQQLFQFDSNGHQLATYDTRTGATLFTFAYDANGHVTSITSVTASNGSGNVTQVQRDAQGNPTAIISPYGQSTSLTLDSNGFLAAVTDPDSNTNLYTYDLGGLMQTHTDPNGHQSTYAWDAVGHLLKDSDPAGGSHSLTRSALANGFGVSVTTALGRTSQYQTQGTGSNQSTNTYIGPDGLATSEQVNPDGSNSYVYADGTTKALVYGPDPRFGMQAPLASAYTIQSPSGLTYDSTLASTATLADVTNPLSLVTESSVNVVNNRTFTSTYVAATRVMTDTTPAGRQTLTTYDSQGRVVQQQVDGLAPVTYAYDGHGRLSSTTQGTGGTVRTTSTSYNAQGYVSSQTDAMNNPTSFTYDAAGRVTSVTLPDGSQMSYAYDANGNRTSLTPPGRPATTMTYTPVNLLASLVAPTAGTAGTTTSYAYDADQSMTTLTRPDGSNLTQTYDSAGRLATQVQPTSTYTYAYNPTTGMLSGITSSGGSTLSYTYDGTLLTGTTLTGTVQGSLTLAYNSDFQIASSTVAGGQTISYQYDPDDLVTQAGAIALGRDSQTGLVTSTTLGNVATTQGYNSFGELTSYAANNGATGLYTSVLTRDNDGRITQKVETVQGVSTTYGYTYDPNGRLSTVTTDGTTTATYTYDANGNRLSGPGATGSYDNQDRLLSYGNATYTYTANGDLLAKTAGGQTTTYTYDALGNLVTVILPSGERIDYVIDGQNRRVGKKVNGVLQEGYLYQGANQLVGMVDGNNHLIAQFIYGSQSNVPDYMIQTATGQVYRFVTDPIGSVLMVVNDQTGTVAQRLSYDAFGQVLTNTSTLPFVQPFGFGGGLYDPDTGLVRFGARDYDASVGRWTTKDPLLYQGGEPNLYEYLNDDPINSVDTAGTGCGGFWQWLQTMLGIGTGAVAPAGGSDAAGAVSPLINIESSGLTGMAYYNKLIQLTTNMSVDTQTQNAIADLANNYYQSGGSTANVAQTLQWIQNHQSQLQPLLKKAQDEINNTNKPAPCPTCSQ